MLSGFRIGIIHSMKRIISFFIPLEVRNFLFLLNRLRFRLLTGFIAFALFPSVAFAAEFERDLYFGIYNNSGVKILQEFLRDEGIYTGPVTGNFLLLTQEGVKRFQEREKISPIFGYFGPKTRARANAILSVKISPEALQEKISQLQKQLEALKSATATVISPEEASPASAAPVVAVPVEKPKVLSVSGYSTSTFPLIETILYKIGEITVSNNTTREVLFSFFEVTLFDEMDSVENRNQKVFFLLRDGLDITSPLISKTEYTFVLTPPKLGDPYRAIVQFPFPELLASGKEKKAALWVEQMKYVRSGTLRIQSLRIITTAGENVEGGFDFVLTKEPPL